jgi:reactive intermediate/imine deaminase
MTRQAIQTPAAPAALGTYSQAIRAGNQVYLSGQLGLDPATGQLREGIEAQITQAFTNLKTVAQAAGGSLDHTVKLSLFLTDLAHFPKVNEIMATFFAQPYPARSTVGVASLPKGALFEADAILVLD